MGRRNALRLLGAIVLGGVAGPVMLLVGLRASLAGSVSLLLNLELAATAVLGVLWFREPLGPTGLARSGRRGDGRVWSCRATPAGPGSSPHAG